MDKKRNLQEHSTSYSTPRDKAISGKDNSLCLYDKSSQAMNTIIKEEDLNRDEMFYIPSGMPQFPQSMNNFEVVETIGNTMSIPENSSFTIPYNDEMNQLLMSNTGDENFGKIPIDFGNLFKLNGIKNEQPISTSHFVKYKPDENGKHVKIWECGICHKEFGHQYILMRHLPTHTDERKFQCKQCGKAFRQMSTLSQHRAIHSKLRPYICEVCQKTFNRVSTLISHRKTHTGLKPHRCHLCNKAFHQKGNLRNHIFTHTNERPYKCDVCQKGFNQMSNLMCHKFKAHQRADKPKYNCQTCGKEFDKRIGLRNHEQYEHGEPTLASTVVNVPSVKCWYRQQLRILRNLEISPLKRKMTNPRTTKTRKIKRIWRKINCLIRLLMFRIILQLFLDVPAMIRKPEQRSKFGFRLWRV